MNNIKRVISLFISVCMVFMISGCEKRGNLKELETRKNELLQQITYLQNEAQKGINTGKDAVETVQYNLSEAQNELLSIQESIARIKQASRFELSPDAEYQEYEY